MPADRREERGEREGWQETEWPVHSGNTGRVKHCIVNSSNIFETKQDLKDLLDPELSIITTFLEILMILS